MLAAEGAVHKRQRRVATPAFSVQNMRALVPLVFNKGAQLKTKWLDLIRETPEPLKIDVCHWISRATFDVIGLAGRCFATCLSVALTLFSRGFDYSFNAIENEHNELFSAYKEMFEVAVSQSHPFKTMFRIYMPFISSLFVRFLSLNIQIHEINHLDSSQMQLFVLSKDVKPLFAV